MSSVFTVEFKYGNNYHTGLITEQMNSKGDCTYRVSLFDAELRFYFPMGSLILRIVKGNDNMYSRLPGNVELSDSIIAAIRNYVHQHPVATL